MINSVTRITLNLQETNTMVSVKAKRGDTSRKLLIHLSDGSIPYHISDDCYVIFTAKKPDGTRINNPCTIENNVIHYEFTPQTCSAVGTMKAEIKLYGADDKMITSACFLISVYDTVYTEGDEVSSESEMNTLDDLILRANTFLNETGKLLRWQGEWDSEAEYEANDLVLHQEILYVAEDAAAAGAEPGSEGAAWMPIAGMGTGSGASASDEQLYGAVSAYVTKNPLVEIKSVEQTQTSSSSSGLNIFTVELSTGVKKEFRVHNGQVGPMGPRGMPGPSVMGPQGPAGEDGADGGHYVPSVSQPDANTLQFDFTPSQDGMPAVEPVQVELPAGQGSGENVDFSSLDLAFLNGKLYITVNGATVGNGVKIGSAEAETYYNIVLNLTNCVSSNTATTATEHSEYTTVISAEENYIMNKLTVTMGGETLTPENGTIHIEDVTGEIQITASAVANTGGVDLSGVEEWYQPEVQSAYNHVAAMDSTKWVHHVVLADTHYGYNQYGNSMEIVTALMNTGRFDKFIHLGDLVDSLTDSSWQGVIEDGYENHNGNMLFVYGNHDANVSSDTLTTGIYKTALLSNGNFTWFDGADYCYYYDDTERKIRYVCLNIWPTSITDSQVAWLNGLLAQMESDWTVFVLVHGEVSRKTTAFYDGLVFSDVNIGGVIEGHWHVDRLFATKNVNRVRLLCDRGGDPGSSDDDNLAPTEAQRVQGTNFEHAITIMSINPTDRKVEFYRIGAYADSYRSVAPKILEYNYEPGNVVHWNDGYWMSGGEIGDSEGSKYETQYYHLKANTPIYVYCASGENTLTEGFVAMFNTKNLSDFYIRKALNETDGWSNLPFSLAGNIGYYVHTSDIYASISCNGWGTGEYAITENPDDIGIFTEKPTMWALGFVSSGGTLRASETEAYSNIIKVKPNTTYTLGSTAGELSAVHVGMYKAPYEKAFIKRVTTATFTTTEDCKYVVMSAEGVIGNEDSITFEEVVS